MKTSQLERMSVADLEAMQAKISASIERNRQREAENVRKQAEEIAKAAGFDLSELFPPNRKYRKRQRA